MTGTDALFTPYSIIIPGLFTSNLNRLHSYTTAQAVPHHSDIIQGATLIVVRLDFSSECWVSSSVFARHRSGDFSLLSQTPTSCYRISGIVVTMRPPARTPVGVSQTSVEGSCIDDLPPVAVVCTALVALVRIEG